MSSLKVKVSEAYFSSDWIYKKEHLELGVTNDGFLLNNILIKRKECTFRSLEMRSKRSGACDKIWICSVIFSKVQGLQYYFPENLECKLKFYESEHFSDSSLHHPDLENSKILGNFCFSEQILYRKQSLGAPWRAMYFNHRYNGKTTENFGLYFPSLRGRRLKGKGKGVLVVSRPNSPPLPLFLILIVWLRSQLKNNRNTAGLNPDEWQEKGLNIRRGRHAT